MTHSFTLLTLSFPPPPQITSPLLCATHPASWMKWRQDLTSSVQPVDGWKSKASFLYCCILNPCYSLYPVYQCTVSVESSWFATSHVVWMFSFRIVPLTVYLLLSVCLMILHSYMHRLVSFSIWERWLDFAWNYWTLDHSLKSSPQILLVWCFVFFYNFIRL